MKRSEINNAIELALDVLQEHDFHLPLFGYWGPDDWSKKGPECDRIRKNGLGWDITDFGGGDFDSFGTVQFTLRNGNHADPSEGTPYAEKIIVLKPGQRLPMHFHYQKTEDIINRGGGVLVMELYNAREEDTLDKESGVRVYCDGIEREVAPGELLELHPGESITLTPRLYHKFWAKRDGGVLICG
ncbi:MAG: D-lyxose/D-mannose family sugar isomerase, partial [Armatimonadota bacterium]